LARYACLVAVLVASLGVTCARSGYIADRDAPVVISLSVVNGGLVTRLPLASLFLHAADAMSPISGFCLRVDNSSQPGARDRCWTPVSADAGHRRERRDLKVTGHEVFLGFAPGAYTIYAWARDAAGNVSVLSSAGSGTRVETGSTFVMSSNPLLECWRSLRPTPLRLPRRRARLSWRFRAAVTCSSNGAPST